MRYDVLFFEALGEENAHLREELEKAKQAGLLPEDLRFLITTDTLQAYLAAHPETELPKILSTKTHSVLPEEWLKGEKKSVITRSAGYDHFERYASIANITSLREYCVNAVAETALKFVFCTCGNLNEYTVNAEKFERNSGKSFREITGRRAVVFGCGRIGRRIYELCRGVGLETVAVDLRRRELEKEYGDVVFAEKDEVFDADVILCAMNYTASPESRFYNAGYFSEDYLSRFGNRPVFINVTRGEIAPEGGIWDLYRKGKLFGLGLDVFGHEAKTVPLLRGEKEPENEDEKAVKEIVQAALGRTENVYVQPHQAFNSDKAALDKAVETVRHLTAYYKNGGAGFDSQLPYYQ